MHYRRVDQPTKRPKHPDKQYDELVQAAWNAGWFVEKKKSGHFACYPEDETKDIVVIPGTGSDHRGPANARAQFRRSGLNV